MVTFIFSISLMFSKITEQNQQTFLGTGPPLVHANQHTNLIMFHALLNTQVINTDFCIRIPKLTVNTKRGPCRGLPSFAITKEMP